MLLQPLELHTIRIQNSSFAEKRKDSFDFCKDFSSLQGLRESLPLLHFLGASRCLLDLAASTAPPIQQRTIIQGNMMILAGCLLAALASGCAAFQQTSPAPSSIAAAFQRDDFTMARNVTFQDAFAAMATANNATTLSTGNPKRTYYVSGATPFNMGYALAAVGYDDLEILATTFLDHIVPSLLDKKLDQELQNGSWAFAYDILLEAFAGWLVNETTISFNEVYAAEAVPTYFLDEMKGLVAGAAAVNPFTQVTLDRLIALNFGIDWISSRLYSGTLLSSLQSWATTQPAVVRAFVESLTHKDLKPPVYCDAFAASGAATAGGDQSIFARDFQLATGLVLQDIESMIIWNTLDGRMYVLRLWYTAACCLRPRSPSPLDYCCFPCCLCCCCCCCCCCCLAMCISPLVGVGAVGFVGSMTAMNNKGFAMGVDTLRSSFVNATFPGINSLFLVRATAHASSTSEEATEYIAAARRGVTWLYPMSDMQGDGRIIESGRYEDSNVVPDLSTLVEDEGLRDDLPPYSFLQQHSPVDYR